VDGWTKGADIHYLRSTIRYLKMVARPGAAPDKRGFGDLAALLARDVCFLK
jgi:hypothetical protein